MLIPIPETKGLYSVCTETRNIISHHNGGNHPRIWTQHPRWVDGFRHVKLYLKGYHRRDMYFTDHDMEKLIKENEKQLEQKYVIGFKQTDGRFGFMLDDKGSPAEYGLTEVLSTCAKSAIKNPGNEYTYYKKEKTCRANNVVWL